MNCYKCTSPIPDDSRFCLSCGADVSGASSGERTLAVEADAELGRKLKEEVGADFQVERELGRGGMAVVFLATDAHLGRKVAIKVLPPELTFGTGMVERFKREARTAATLDHANIIPIYRVSTGGKLFWYAMKYLEGEALNDILQREGALPPERIADILHQVADALDYAHSRGVIHRDIKPANVMLDDRGRVTVTDFGIAKALNSGALTGSGSMIGTPYYMSPEQCAGKKTITGAADQYSLGVMCYQLLSGHLPFTGDSVIDIIKQHCMDPVPPLGVLKPDLPPPLVQVVEKALAKAAEDRFPCVLDFSRAFAAAAAGATTGLGLESSGKRSRPSVTADISPIPGSLRLGGTPQPGAARKRPARLWLAAGAGVVAVIAVAVVFGRGILGGAATPATQTAQNPPAVTAPAPVQSPSAQASAAETSTVAVAPPADAASATPAGGTARLTLRGIPAGAVITRNGGRVAGSPVRLDAGRRNVVTVTAQGFDPWTETFAPRAGQAITRILQLRPATPATQVAAAQAPGAQRQGAQPAQQTPTAPVQAQSTAPTPAAPAPAPAVPALQAQPPAAQPPAAQPQPAAAPATARITVGSRQGGMTINGRPAPSNPVSNYEVPAGVVRLRFTVTDSTGIWSWDTTVTVGAGDTRRIGYLQPRRP